MGSGNIGTDLLIKTLRSKYLDCRLFIGRRLGTPGMAKASSLGVPVSDQSIDAIVRDPSCCDLVFDATSALDHRKHWSVLKELGKMVIDLTPANVGLMGVPAVNLDECLDADNVNMVSCGGQASIPLAHCLGKTQGRIRYIEVVSTIASKSAGPGTRLNMDEYIETTESGLRQFSDCDEAKVILNLNPADPPIFMHTTVSALVESPDLEALRPAIDSVVSQIQRYVPGYRLVVPPVIEDERIVMMARVEGRGDYLQRYAGNLDIINCAALATAEAYAKRSNPESADTVRA